MTDSSPADLAVAFRSFPRRLREGLAAVAGDADAAAAARPHAAAVEHGLAAAAAVMGTASTGEPAVVAAALADAVAAVHPDRWDEAALDALRGHALAVGRALRALDDLAG